MVTDHEFEKNMDLLRSEGITCKIVIENIGYNKSSRALATAAFGIIGLAGTMGTKKENKPGVLYVKEKGLRFIPKSLSSLEIRIPWDNIIHAGRDYSKLFIYTSNEDKLVFSITSAKCNILIDVIEKKSPNLLKKDLEGWD